MKKLVNQILKFGVVGFLCFFIDYGILFVLREFAGMDVLIASGISFSVSVIVNYILSMTLVFEGKDDANKFVEFMIFLVLSIIGLGINQVVMSVGCGFLDQYIAKSYLIVKIFATAIVMVYNFITRKLFLEKKEK